MSEILRHARDRADLVALGVLLLAVVLLPSRIPGGVYGLGLVSGAALALNAIGLVLVYRSTRIINFAQVQIGVLAALLFRLFVEQSTFLRAVRALCGPCLSRFSDGAVAVNYWLSLAFAVAFAIAITWLVYTFVIRRFAGTPRLVLTVATVGIAQLLASLQAALPGLMATGTQRDLNQVPTGVAAPPPVDVSVGWEPAIFRAADLLTVAVAIAAVAGLAAFFRYSRRGLALQASAENPERAATLGINVDAAVGRSWLIAGALSAAAGILAAMSSPAAPPAALDVAITVRILAAAVIASMTSLPVAGAAALVLGLFDQAMLWTFESAAVADGLLAGVIAAVLLLQRPATGRSDRADATWRAAREIRAVPPALAERPEIRLRRRIAAGAGLLLLAGYPFIMSPLQTARTTTAIIYGLVGLSLLILSGWAGQISLGQFALAGGGAYVASLAAVHLSLPMPLALLAGGVAGAVGAVLIGVPALRMRGLHLAITTLAVSLAASSILFSPSELGRFVPSSLERPAWLGFDLEDGRSFYFVTLLIVAAAAAGVRWLRRSRFGRTLIAARDNEPAAQAFGISVVGLRVQAFAISGFLAGAAGALLAYQQFGLKAASFAPDTSVVVFLMALIGGLGALSGPLIGAGYLGVLSIAGVSPLVLFLATGGGLVFLLMTAPGGLAQIAAAVRDAALRRFARRRGIPVPSLMGRDGADAERGRLAPKSDGEGRAAFVPRRYRLDDQWAIAEAAEAHRG